MVEKKSLRSATRKKEEEAKELKEEEKMEGVSVVQPDGDGQGAMEEIKRNCALLERAVNELDARYTLRVLKTLTSIRKTLSADLLGSAIAALSCEPFLLEAVVRRKEGEGERAAGPAMVEIDIYLGLLVQVYFFDQKDFAAGLRFSQELARRVHALNKRSLDLIGAKVYFYLAACAEKEGQLEQIHAGLLAAHRTATLRHDMETQATLITCLLRSYLLASQIERAATLQAKIEFPQRASNGQVARYFYYLGRIRAVQLNYTDAHNCLLGAIRKAPSSSSAAGFLQSAHKLSIIVQLLMGDIPDRKIFRQAMLERTLAPYYELVKAVRGGDVKVFAEVSKANEHKFRADANYSLILRLRQNVIKTGIRALSLCYSRISLRDICVKLSLDSEESAEYMVAKAIRDGVIEASLDHERGYMKSVEVLDVYATSQPQEQFHQRIQYCLNLHNENVKAMRFPMNQHRVELKNAEEARERERELAKEIQDGEIDEEEGDFEGL